jgi:hypothetical protein
VLAEERGRGDRDNSNDSKKNYSQRDYTIPIEYQSVCPREEVYMESRVQ